MKKTLLILFVAFMHLLCVARERSRIVFIKIDADGNGLSTPISEWRLYSNTIMRNGDELTEIRSNSVFIYDDTDVGGTYYLQPGANKEDERNKSILLKPAPHSITIFKLSLSESLPVTSSIEVLSLSDLEQYYEQYKWLRKRLAAKGYNSPQELVNGYTITTAEAARQPLAVMQKHKGRSNVHDTLFYDTDGAAATRENAARYSVLSQESERYYAVKVYETEHNLLMLSGHYTSIDSEAREGEFLSYSKYGTLTSKITYKNDKQEGPATHYYDTLGTIWYTSSYVKGHEQGLLTSYYKSGKIKRKEVHERLVTADVAANAGGRKSAGPQVRDTIVSGHCYDEAGNEIKFTPFEIMPKAPYSLEKYLGKNLKYPNAERKRNISGRVLVKFVIDTTGNVTNTIAVRHVSEAIDAEAVRVVSLMPPWAPGLQDDRPIKVYFTLPITFKLD